MLIYIVKFREVFQWLEFVFAFIIASYGSGNSEMSDKYREAI